MRNEKTPQEHLLDQNMDRPNLIRWIEERLADDDRLGINIGLQEGLILRSLCTQKSIEKVAEFGTQYGCSASWMAMGLGKRGQIYTMESDPECVKNSQETFAHEEFKVLGCQVEILEGDARGNMLILNEKGPFDLIFIDANKAAYLDYLHWAKQNLSFNGVIVIDNIYLFGSMFLDVCPDKTPEKMWNVMKQVIAEQMRDDNYNSCIIPTPEGLLVSYKKWQPS